MLKDYALEPDSEALRKSAHLMVTGLAQSLALVTAKEPLRIAVANNLRTLLTNQLDANTLEQVGAGGGRGGDGAGGRGVTRMGAGGRRVPRCFIACPASLATSRSPLLFSPPTTTHTHTPSLPGCGHACGRQPGPVLPGD